MGIELVLGVFASLGASALLSLIRSVLSLRKPVIKVKLNGETIKLNIDDTDDLEEHLRSILTEGEVGVEHSDQAAPQDPEESEDGD